MKKLLIVLGVLICSAAQAEQIDKYQTDIQIQSNGEIAVAETINYNFGSAQKHGIFRDILVSQKNSDHQYYAIQLSNISVTDELNNPYKYTQSSDGQFIKLKIGDPNKTISGKHTYKINYTAQGAISSSTAQQDELYWNSTGNDWPGTIISAITNVKLPIASGNTNYPVKCIWGSIGEKRVCSANFNQTNYLATYTQNNLRPGQGMTIVAGWPKGLVKVPDRKNFLSDTKPISYGENYGEQVSLVSANFLNKGHNPYIISFVYLAALFSLMYNYWNKNGRDAKSPGPIIAEYEVPDNLRPAEVGIIKDNNLSNAELSAEIIKLAIDGYLIIERQKKTFSTDYMLTSLKDGKDLTDPYVKELFENLFHGSVNLRISTSSLKNHFYKCLPDIEKATYSQVFEKGYYRRNPQQNNLMTIAVMFFFFTFVGTVAIVTVSGSFLYVLTSIIAAIMMSVFVHIMPSLTDSGAQVKNKILGLKLYLGVAEKDRIEFHNAPEKNPQTFEHFLPYAMVLGVEKQWAAQFADIYIAQPNWYQDPSMTAFSIVNFTSAMSSLTTTTSTNMSTSPSSSASGGSGFSSGGFSGGGGGGGGGGSW